MKTAMPMASPALADPNVASTWPEASLGERLSAYSALTKPRITLLVLMSAAVGYLLGARQGGGVALGPLAMAMLGTALVASGASAWNQYLERSRDRRMRRTAGRPLPSGRLAPAEAALFGTALALVGVALLAAGPNPLAAGVALATFLLYAFVYTPLKPVTTLNTAIGAVPGALPPVIGWAAATGRLGIEPLALFLVLFLWQFPHFLAIAWIHRADYERAGYRMLPAVDPEGRITGRQAAGHALALLPAGLLPAVVGLAGPLYFAGALGLGVFYLASAARFWSDVSEARARALLWASIVYLPAILLLLLIDPGAA